MMVKQSTKQKKYWLTKTGKKNMKLIKTLLPLTLLISHQASASFWFPSSAREDDDNEITKEEKKPEIKAKDLEIYEIMNKESEKKWQKTEIENLEKLIQENISKQKENIKQQKKLSKQLSKQEKQIKKYQKLQKKIKKLRKLNDDYLNKKINREKLEEKKDELEERLKKYYDLIGVNLPHPYLKVTLLIQDKNETIKRPSLLNEWTSEFYLDFDEKFAKKAKKEKIKREEKEKWNSYYNKVLYSKETNDTWRKFYKEKRESLSLDLTKKDKNLFQLKKELKNLIKKQKILEKNEKN